jgi:non-heme chloroperoxidase
MEITNLSPVITASRRSVLLASLGAAATAASLPGPANAAAAPPAGKGATNMENGFITLKDGVQIYYKDWGPKDAPVVFFHHGWPLTSDDWDGQMMFFLANGFRVIAHDRRGHGRSTQTYTGNDMNTYCADVAQVVEVLKLKNAIHVGHSTGGGEVARYVARFGKGLVRKAVLISAIPPVMIKSEKNPDGVPKDVFDGIRKGTAYNRAQFYQDFTMPFYGYNRPGAKASQGVRDNWWRQAMMGGIKAAYDCIAVFSETDFTEDLKIIDIPVLVMHGEDDQIVPFQISAPKSAKLLKQGKLKSYPGFPHGMPTTHADVINADLLAFFKA